jgi:hypothetical protein
MCEKSPNLVTLAQTKPELNFSVAGGIRTQVLAWMHQIKINPKIITWHTSAYSKLKKPFSLDLLKHRIKSNLHA